MCCRSASIRGKPVQPGGPPAGARSASLREGAVRLENRQCHRGKGNEPKTLHDISIRRIFYDQFSR